MEPRDPTKEEFLSSCPDEIKFEIIKHLDEVADLCRFGSTCTTWNIFLKSEKIWKPLFIKDFLSWNPDQLIKLKEGETWKQKYEEFFRKGWQWDPSCCNNNIDVSEDCLSVSLRQGFSYNGVRANRGENTGRHYFEVQIEDSPVDRRLSKGSSTSILMGIGIATDKFNVHNCSVGWTNENNGIGYYSDGQIYALGQFHSSIDGTKRPYHSGDRIAVEFDLNQGTVIFYLNDEQVTAPIGGLSNDLHFPFLILAADVKNNVIITRGKGKKRTAKNASTLPTKKYQTELETLKNMGFCDEELCTELLVQFNGNVERVVNNLLESDE